MLRTSALYAISADVRLEVNNIKKHVKELISEFSDKKVFTREMLKSFYKTRTKDLKDSSFSWVVYHLCEDKVIQRLGYNMFQLYNKETMRIRFNPSQSDDLSKIALSVTTKFPLLTFSVWELWMLNEFLNHQIERNIIVLDVEKHFEESVIDAIKVDLNSPILYKPNQKELDLYSGYVTVIVSPLIKEAPKSTGENIIAPLEKILVDIFSNKSLQNSISIGEYSNIFEGAFSKYLVDEKSMFRYARRRKKEQEILSFIHNNTSIHLLMEELND